MKRHLVPCLALSASLILTGCSSGQTHEETLLSQAAGIASDAAVLSVDGRDVPAWQVLYWLAYACDYIAASYEDGAIQWNDTVEGETLEDYAKDQALQNAVLYATVENWAEDYGCTLDDEDRTAMDREWAAKAAQYGGEDAYLAELAKMGLDRSGAERLSQDSYLYQHLYDLFETEDSALHPSDQDLETFAREQQYLTVDHIWISTAAGAPSDTAYISGRRARAEEVFSKLNASPDPMNDFAVLAETYSDETNRDQHPTGYTCTVGDGTLPANCEEAAQSLEEGQWSGILEADDGFYLILRKPVDLEAVAPDYFDALLQAAADSAEVSVSKAYERLSARQFYDALTAGRSALENPSSEQTADS